MRLQRTRQNSQKRDIVLVATRAGKLVVEAQFDLHISQVPRPEPKRPAPSENDRATWLAPAPGIPLEAPVVATVLDKLTRDKPETDALVTRLFEHASGHIRITPAGNDDGGEALEQRKASALGATRAMVALLRAAHLPARVVTGLDVSASEGKQPHYWAEVYTDNRWRPLDVAAGHRDDLPPTRVPLRKGSELVVETENAQVTKIHWRILPDKPPKGLLTSDTPHVLDVLDLSRLLPGTRTALGLLLLLPLGGLSTEILRHLGGIRTYGTFSPTLLALAAVFVEWHTAVVTFTLVTILAVAGRAMLPDLKLTRIPRLSIVFTLVSLVMALVVSLLIHLDPAVDSTVVLLPIVILTMLVDRFYAVADESGLRVALIRLVWTVVAAVLSLAVLLQAHWGEWLLAFPEVHAITVAVIILLGRYRGRRLAELRWLNWLREPAVKRSVQRNGRVDRKTGQSGSNSQVLPASTGSPVLDDSGRQ
jgi:hypothetical protein